MCNWPWVAHLTFTWHLKCTTPISLMNSIIIDGGIAREIFYSVKNELDAFHESQFFSIEHFTWPLNCQEIPKHSLGVFYNLRSSYMLPMCTLNVTMTVIDVTLTN